MSKINVNQLPSTHQVPVLTKQDRFYQNQAKQFSTFVNRVAGCTHPREEVYFETDNNGGAIAICENCNTELELDEPPYFKEDH